MPEYNFACSEKSNEAKDTQEFQTLHGNVNSPLQVKFAAIF